jgi:hypothetical protein
MRNPRRKARPSNGQARSGNIKVAESANDRARLPPAAASSSWEITGNFQQVTKMASREQLNMLSRMVDEALRLAVELDETMAAYILSIASREVSERIEGKEARKPFLPE